MQVADQWLNAAKAELDGTDPFAKLASAKGNIKVKPWYDRFDVQKDQTFILPAEKIVAGCAAMGQRSINKGERCRCCQQKRVATIGLWRRRDSFLTWVKR